MRYAREVLRVALSGTGFLFVPLLLLTALWVVSFLMRCAEVGLTEATAHSWIDAALLKGAWFLGGVRGVYRLRRGCQE